MHRPYSFPGGKVGAVAGAVPPIAICCLMFYLSDWLTIVMSIGFIFLSLVSFQVSVDCSLQTNIAYGVVLLLKRVGCYQHCPGKLAYE
jgi:hypothetical protein